MKNYTRHMISIACLMMSANALADGYKGEAPPSPPVTIPQLKGGFDIGISALFMTPTSSNLAYLGVSKVPSGTDILTHDYDLTYNVSPNDNWGFIFDLGYVFPNTANDVRLDWMAFHSNYENQHKTVGQAGMLTNVFFFPTGHEVFFADTDFVKASATINYKLDALDLTFGQYLNIYQRLQTRMFTGLRYARVDSGMNSIYTAEWNTIFPVSTNGGFGGSLNSSFNGLGPMIGTRADFDLGKGLALTGSFDVALLTGQLSFSGDQVIHMANTVTSTVIRNAFNWGTQNIIAPAFDAKFGLNYQYQFNNGTQLIGELGYQVSQYFDVIEQVNPEAAVIAGAATSLNHRAANGPTFGSTDVTDFGLRGPYLTLRVKV